MMPQEIHWNYLGNTFTWKDGRKLESITKADGSAITYTYDSEGNRIGKQIRKPDGIEEKTTYYWDGGKLLREVSGDETLYYSYDSNGKLWSMDWEKGDTKKGYFVIRNAQGDITGLYHREDSSLAGSYTYDAWGQLLSVNPANESDEEILRKNPFRYRGYYYDEESGYYFLQSRYYNPEVRRFLNADTLVAETGNGVGYNLFAYSSNQPVNYKDESGHVLDTVMDVVSIGIDVVEIAQNPTDPVSWICLGADVACAVIPVATGGGLAVRAAGKVDDAVDAVKTADHVGDAVKSGSSSGKYQVGAYQDIKGVEGLDAHHVGQKALMKKLVADYDELTAPAINVPKLGHTKRHPERGIVSRSTKGITNARQLLARDLFELKRVYPDIPNSALKELIDMNKKMYPEMRK